MIPFKYNFRNLRERWVTTLMTVVAISIVVSITVLVFGFVDGMERALRVSGDPTDLIALRQGSNDETGSTVDIPAARDIANLPGIAKTAEGVPMCSSEYVTILVRPRRDGTRTNLIVRGLESIGRTLRSEFKIVRGRDLEPGVNEAITSEAMARRFQNLAIGEKLEINKVEFTIVGYFSANGTSAESEVWTERRDLISARRIPDSVSSVNLRCTDEATLKDIKHRLENDEQFKLKAVRETEYFEEQMSSTIALKIFGYVLFLFLTFGAMFAAANTMYAAVAGRAREIGTLRALGFSRRSILVSFLLESVLLCLMGALLGCVATLAFRGWSGGTANWSTFSEITFSFQFGPMILIRGVVMALAMGLLGGILPAIRAVRLTIVDSLRQV